MKCTDIKNLLSEYIDGALDESNRLIVSDHLKTCKNCSGELDSLKQTVSLLKSREPVEPPSDFVFQVRKKIEERQWWKEAFKMIFYPFHIKIPLEAIATIAIVCVLYSVYHEKEPLQLPKYIPEEAIVRTPKIEAPTTEEKSAPRTAESLENKQIIKPEIKKDMTLKDSYGKVIPTYNEMERRSAVQKSIIEKEQKTYRSVSAPQKISYEIEPQQNLKRNYTAESLKTSESEKSAYAILGEEKGDVREHADTYKEVPASPEMSSQTETQSNLIKNDTAELFKDSKSGKWEKAEISRVREESSLVPEIGAESAESIVEIKPEHAELIVKLTNHKKDILKIKKYINFVNGKIIKETPEGIIKIKIQANDYSRLLKILTKTGLITKLDCSPEQSGRNDIIILIKTTN